MRAAYRELITNLSRLLGGNESSQSESDVTEIIQLDSELAKVRYEHSVPTEDRTQSRELLRTTCLVNK